MGGRHGSVAAPMSRGTHGPGSPVATGTTQALTTTSTCRRPSATITRPPTRFSSCTSNSGPTVAPTTTWWEVDVHVGSNLITWALLLAVVVVALVVGGLALIRLMRSR